MNFKDAWGFSKLDVFRTCKAKFKYQFMEKLPSGSSPAMERGQKIHENIEAYLNGWVTELHPDAESWKEHLDLMKTKDFQAEQALGFDREWSKLTDWFGKDTWLRVKMDAKYREGTKLVVIDFKTGKYRVPSPEQVELYALAGYHSTPGIDEVVAEMWYIDTGDVYSKTYKEADMPMLQKKYETYAAPMYAELQWEPEPSNECRWCPYSKTKGGKCKY